MEESTALGGPDVKKRLDRLSYSKSVPYQGLSVGGISPVDFHLLLGVVLALQSALQLALVVIAGVWVSLRGE